MALYHTSRPPTTASLETGASSVKQHLIALLCQAGARWRAEAVAQCASEFWALRCAHGHVVQAIPVEWCRYRLCPDCARRRQTRAFNRILPAMRTLQRRYPHNRWVLITLTLPSTHEHVKKIIARFKRWFAKLRRASQWKDCIRGGVYSIEVTYHPDTGWHVHAHLLAARMAWWDQADLTAAWRHASEGNGQIVDMRDRDRDVRSGRGAVLKYLFKPPNLRDWGPPKSPSLTSSRASSSASAMGPCAGSPARWKRMRMKTSRSIGSPRRRSRALATPVRHAAYPSRACACRPQR